MTPGGLQEEVILWLQSQGEWLIQSMRVISWFGNGPVYVFAAALLYWCFDRRWGARLFLILILSAGLNSMLKSVFRAPRPYWVSENIRGFGSQQSFGMPSGHAQSAASVSGEVALTIRKRVVYLAVGVFVLLMGFSRIVLGVHSVGQVMIGVCLGFLVAWGVMRAEEPVLRWFEGCSVGVQVGAVVVFSLATIGVGVLVETWFSGFRFSSVWVENAPQTFAGVDRAVDPAAFDVLRGLVKAAGVFCGFVIGLIAVGRGQVGGVEGSWLKKFLRVMVGSIVLVFMWYVSESYQPDGRVLLNIYRFVGTALAGFWISGLAPRIFHRVGLSGTAVERMEST